MRSVLSVVPLLITLAGNAVEAQARTKPSLRGLVAMGRMPRGSEDRDASGFREVLAHPSVYRGVVVDVGWTWLEPSQGRYDFSAIDERVRQAELYNAAHPERPIVLKLRVFGGRLTPAWVLRQTGSFEIAWRGDALVLPAIWSTAYLGLWSRLQQALAARYDAMPVIGEVAVTACSTLTGEPFVFPITPDARVSAQAAGYSDGARRACLEAAPASYAAWRTTPIDLPINPYCALMPTGDGAPPCSLDLPIKVAREFVKAFADRAVLSYHGVGADKPVEQRISEFIERPLGTRAAVATALQTVRPGVELRLYGDRGAALGACELEVWDSQAAGGHAPFGLDELSGLARDVEARCR